MSKLTETQTLVLSRAARREGGVALPLPERLKGGAAQRVVRPLIEKGLLDEVEADLRNSGQPVWRSTGDRHGVTLVITSAGLEALVVETADSAADAANEAPSAADPAEDATAADTAADSTAPREPREGTKVAALIALLRQPDGATMAEMTEVTGWQQHTVRGAIAAAIKKKLGIEVVSDKPQGQDRRWRIAN